ncbi:hypothetical protein K493DRAFT_346394 [Basidiobolus meristosporus CBS 931.73]|uniref:chitin synthase n=1 Tax=Basidiobolus meristosporus CBS 931.73 TaxID=1314790 RepID=A0A1Y1YY86_9FUNG|nr:hypothetical protein K493DRAFT_346394 [Basidiobolus meristosporus CBS 931.73]|eukprot:ORY02993.1 hypothetical protein K493DRAFT_346394 [Basidiobolus meristosporus CBS 931.73]
MGSRKPIGLSEDGHNLVNLSSFNEDEVTSTLRDFYQQDSIFTRIGTRTLVSLNPYKPLDNFNEVALQRYLDDYKDISGQRQVLPPHIFETVSNAYLDMRRTGYDQAIIFSGETGGGKSYIKSMGLRMLAALRESSKKDSHIMGQIQDATNILEAFGNAQTLHNNNASRFGNYTEVQFNERGRVIGAKIMDYLLEKSRVVSPNVNESNFHIFYYLLSGATDEERSHLKLADTNTYLASGSRFSEQDMAMFNTLRASMKSLGFNKKYQNQIFRLLAAILHLGNITFMDHPNRPNEATSIKNEDELLTVAEFLGVNATDLASVLTYKSIIIRKEICTTFLNAKKAEVQRDSLSKALYSLLFSWIVEFINTKLCSDTQSNFIGLVDMPGFQSFESNGFEQFCVNFTNERIHNFINHHIFEAFNEEYQEQGIAAPEVLYFDNSPCLDLFMKPNSGLIALMDKKALGQAESDGETLLESFRKQHSSHSNFHPPPKGSHGNFAIQHFAGQVAYRIDEFSEKNNDTIGSDFIGLFRGGSDMASTSNPFIAGLFSDKTVAYESHPRNESTIVAAQTPAIPTRKPSMRRPRTKPGKDTKKVTGVTTQLKGALDELVETLQETVPWFVLCIRPNDTQKPGQFDSRKVKLQVRYMGLAEIANRRQMDYTTSLTHDEFLERYATVIEPMGLDQTRDAKQKCQTTCTIFGWNEKEMVVGATKVYLGFDAWRDLEDNLRLIEADAKKRKKDGEPSSPHGSMDIPTSPAAVPATFRSISSPTLRDSQSYATSADTRSFYSDDDYFERPENQSAMTSEIFAPQPTMKGPEVSKVEAQLPVEEKEPVSKQRKRWVCCTWFLTWWIPTFTLTTCGRMKRPDIRMAWREKTALCILILFICAIVVFFLIFFGNIICPRQHVYSPSELASYTTKDKPYLAIRGEVFDFKDLNHYGITFNDMKNFAGTDASLLFPVQVNMVCDGWNGLQIDPSVNIENYTLEPYSRYHDYRFAAIGNDYAKNDYYTNNLMVYMRKKFAKGQVAYSTKAVRQKAQTVNGGVWGIVDNKVYDLTRYKAAFTSNPPGWGDRGNVNLDFLDPNLYDTFKSNNGQDVTGNINALYAAQPEQKAQMMRCLRNLFYAGVVDTRNSPQCMFSNYFLLAATVFMMSIILFKFLAALQLGSLREPEDHDKFVVCQVPCYTEGEDSLKRTIDSLAVLKYDDKRKLLFVVADGMIIGGGNDKPTPMIVLDILGHDASVEPEPLAYKALGEGNQQLNMGKVYTGLYECSGHVVPYIVVVKIGKPSERSRPGNRGKRDSQLILMQFFNKVHFNTEMTPLELEMYHQIKNVIGVDPFFYEYVLMVDADTIVLPDSLNRMISCMLNDSKIMGLCGETQLLNEKASFITMIQVFEYFISHHLNKAFESLFGSVTCLPGCFCMYRFRTPIKNQPLLIANVIIEEYSENKVDTLHKKNLLSLGEDRYLTTLMLKHFNYNKMTFTPDAKCQTNAPDEWSVLLSQRRRWINSTIHNLAELLYLPRLCGFCCFSMRFVVFIDLLSTIIMPVQCFYLGFLLYKVITDPSSFPVIAIIMLAAIYGFQIFIFLIKRQWQHIGWMIVYLLSLPIFSLFLPVYAFWHFDDFSWGNTRVVVGEKGSVTHVSTEEKFDPASVPLKKWSDYEQELWEVGTHVSHESKGSSPSARESYRSRSKSRIPDNTSVYTGMAPISTHSIPDPYLPTGMRGRSVSPAPPSIHSHSMSPYPAGPMPGRNPSHSVDRNSRAYSVARSEYRDYSRSRGPTLDVPGYNPRASNASNLSPMMGAPGYHQMQPLGSRPGSVINPVSDHEIMEEIRHILSTANLMSITKKQVRDELSRHFGMDMTHKKEYINNCIDMILQGQL